MNKHLRFVLMMTFPAWLLVDNIKNDGSAINLISAIFLLGLSFAYCLYMGRKHG